MSGNRCVKRRRVSSSPAESFNFQTMWPLIIAYLGQTSWHVYMLLQVCTEWNSFPFYKLISNFRINDIQQLSSFADTCQRKCILTRILKLDIRIHWNSDLDFQTTNKQFLNWFKLIQEAFPNLERLALLSANMDDLSNTHKLRTNLHHAINKSTRSPLQLPYLPKCEQFITDIDLLPMFNFTNKSKLPSFKSLIVRTALVSGKLSYIQMIDRMQIYWERACKRQIFVTIWNEGCCFRNIKSDIPDWTKKTNSVCIVSKQLSTSTTTCGILLQHAYTTFLADFSDVHKTDLQKSMLFSFVKLHCYLSKDVSILHDVFTEKLMDYRQKHWSNDICGGNSTSVCIDMLIEYFHCSLSPHRRYIYGIALLNA